MADDFKALVAAQKETSRLISEQIRQSMTVEERAADDEAIAAKSLERSEAARRGWETRQENLSKGIKKDGKKDALGEEEDSTKDAVASKNQLTTLQKISGFMGNIAKGAKEKIKSGLSGFKKFAFGALAIAAIAFLNSPMFKTMIKFIDDEIIPLIATLYDDYIKPFGVFIKDNLVTFFKDLKTFYKDPSWENLKKFDLVALAATAATALAAITALFGPKLLFKGLKLGVKAFTGALNLAGKGIGKLLPGGGKGGASKLGGIAKGGVPIGGVPKGGGKIAGVAKGLTTMGKAAGQSIGLFIGGILKGIASGLTALGNPVAIAGLLAATAAIVGISAAIRIMKPAFEPIGKMMKSFGESVREVFGGLGDFVKDIGKTIEGIITKMGASIGAVIDKISGMKTAGTDATTKQIKELSAIPAKGMFAAAKGIDAMKKALDGFGGGTMSKVVGSMFSGGGPIDKIIDLTKKVPALMKAAEAINVLGAAGGDYAKTEAELERRKEVVKLKKDIAGGQGTLQSDKSFAAQKAKLAALQGQAMKMDAVGSGGGVGLKRIETLVTEIVKMKKEQQKESKGTNIVTDNSVRKIDSSQAAITQLTSLAPNGTAGAVAAAK